MTQVQLPAHLANRQVRSLTERASEGMGSSLPPHISIQGNSFTFIDAAGTEYNPVLTFDAAIVDVSDVLCKRYFDKPWDPSASTYEPPACWSANGIGPSREATKPQALLCGECPHNERGSKISKLSGAAMKACRDERWIAVLVPQMPQMIFQLVITPGSFKNWKAYTEIFRNYGVELSLGLTRFSFKPKVNGELLFEHVGWVDEATIGAVEAANREKKTDVIVGRTDQPRTALAAPTQQATLPPPNQFVTQQITQQQAQQEVLPPHPAPTGATTQLFTPVAPSTAPNAAPTLPQTMVATSAVPAPAAEQAAPRRRRRTNAEIAAASNPAQGQQAFIPAATPQPSFQPTAPQVPFPVAQTAAPAPAAAQPQFGMAPGAPINPEMAKMLADMGFVRQPA
jgi:hypothetical protein